MRNTALKQELNSYLPLLTVNQQQFILDMVKNLLQVEKTEQRISTKQYNTELDIAEKEIAKNQFISQEDLEKDSKEW